MHEQVVWNLEEYYRGDDVLAYDKTWSERYRNTYKSLKEDGKLVSKNSEEYKTYLPTSVSRGIGSTSISGTGR